MNKDTTYIPTILRRFGFILLLLTSSAERLVGNANDAPKLSGSDLRSEDLILNTDVIFEGKIIKLGTETTTGSNVAMQGNQVELIQFLRCAMQDRIEVDIPVDLGKSETRPKVGVPYIFFVLKNQIRPDAWSMEPHDAVKILSATDANIAEIKRLIELPENYHQLPGSQLKLSEVAAKADSVFVAKVLSLPILDLGPPGITEYYGTPVEVSHVYRGLMANPLSVDFYVHFMPHEDPTAAGQSYIFFTKGEENRDRTVMKILPATSKNISDVEKLVPPPKRTEHNKFICDDLTLHDALVGSDVVFVGRIVDPGTEDRSDSYSFVFPSPHLGGVKMAVSDVFRGTVRPRISSTMFVNHLVDKASSPAFDRCIFFAKNGNRGDKDPFTILKALPATDANLKMVDLAINPPPSSILTGSSLPPEKAVELADVIFIGEVVMPIAPRDEKTSYVKIFKVVRGLVARGDVWINHCVDATKNEKPAEEGGSYIFCLSKTDPYNTDAFNVVKALPAAADNIALVEKLAATVPGPKMPEDTGNIHIAPDANN